MSWPLVAISEFCQTGSGTTPSRKSDGYYGGSIPWIKSGELRENEILGSEELITEKALRETSLKRVPAGSILVAMYGATVGRVGLLGIDATTNQAVCHIIPDKKIADTRYMFHALQHKAAELVSRGVGGAQPNISQGVIKTTQIPLPPLEEQKRIAAILDQADSLRRLRQRAIDRLNSLGQAIFKEMFGPMNLDYSTWPTTSFTELMESAQIGLVRSANDMGEEFDVPYVRMDAIQRDGLLNLANVKRTHATAEEKRNFNLQAGDFLFNTRNSRELVGKTAIVERDYDGVYNNNILRVRFKGGISSEYVHSYFRQPIAQRILTQGNLAQPACSLFTRRTLTRCQYHCPLPTSRRLLLAECAT